MWHHGCCDVIVLVLIWSNFAALAPRLRRRTKRFIYSIAAYPETCWLCWQTRQWICKRRLTVRWRHFVFIKGRVRIVRWCHCLCVLCLVVALWYREEHAHNAEGRAEKMQKQSAEDVEQERQVDQRASWPGECLIIRAAIWPLKLSRWESKILLSPD